ncbi:MAG TPA: hypothetical protein VFQ32_06870 [Ktedonobacterales bacterium]|nr:hypothetical protein [Ktedonobacterales bacterium]
MTMVMADGDEQGDEYDVTAHDDCASSESHEGVVIEGLRPPLTHEQRRRRTAITAVVIAGALLALLWPAVSAFGGKLPSTQPLAQATATPNVATYLSVSTTSAIVVSSGSYVTDCIVTPQTTSSLGLRELHADASGGNVWALLLSGPTLWAKSAMSVVWKATGSGAFKDVAYGPGDSQLPPTSGPDQHGGSNWQRRRRVGYNLHLHTARLLAVACHPWRQPEQ